MFKKSVQAIAGVAIALSLVSASALAASEVKIALDTPPDLKVSGTYNWVKPFGEYLNKNGLKAAEFPRGALGEEAEKLDQVQQGLLEVSMSDLKSAGSLESLSFGMLLPYFFKDTAQLDRALSDGGMMDKLNASLTKKGVRILAMIPLGLPAGIMNTKKPIKTVADMADLRMRALDKRQIALFESWGTNGTIVSWSEVPNALQTGIADGYVNPPMVPLMFGHTDFIKHFTDARISTGVRLALASEDWYQGLSDDERKTVDAAVVAANKAQRAWLATRGDAILKSLEDAGIQVVTLTDEARAEFQIRSKDSWVSDALTAEQVAQWAKARDK